VEYETPSWTERERTPIVEIMSDGVEWEYTGAQDAA
jgi:hypothetical protein